MSDDKCSWVSACTPCVNLNMICIHIFMLTVTQWVLLVWREEAIQGWVTLPTTSVPSWRDIDRDDGQGQCHWPTGTRWKYLYCRVCGVWDEESSGMDFWKRAQETGCSELTFILASIHVHALSTCMCIGWCILCVCIVYPLTISSSLSEMSIKVH